MGLKLDKARDIVSQFSNTPKASLAELLLKDNSSLYKDKEEARSYIRKATGSYGKKNRERLLPIAKQEKYPNGIVYNPYQLEEQDHNSNAPYNISVSKETVMGILSDIHLPYQHNEALTLALDKCKQEKITHLYLNGDIIDAFEISVHEKDPNKRQFKYELDVARQFLKTLVDNFPNTKIYYKEGNHEARYVKFLRRKAPELLGFEVLKMQNLLGLKDLGIEYIKDSKITHAGKLTIIHGHEFGKHVFNPVNPARGFFLRSKTNVIGGHCHQNSSHSENTLKGESLVAYSTGHLADPHPEYMPINNWSHGFAIVRFKERGNFMVNNYKIINGELY